MVRTTCKRGLVDSPAIWNMRIKPYPAVSGTTIKRGWSVKPGEIGLRLARLRKKSAATAKSATPERSQIPAHASVARQFLPRASWYSAADSFVSCPSNRASRILLTGSNSNRNAMRALILPGSPSELLVSPVHQPFSAQATGVSDYLAEFGGDISTTDIGSRPRRQSTRPG